MLKNINNMIGERTSRGMPIFTDDFFHNLECSLKPDFLELTRRDIEGDDGQMRGENPGYLMIVEELGMSLGIPPEDMGTFVDGTLTGYNLIRRMEEDLRRPYDRKLTADQVPKPPRSYESLLREIVRLNEVVWRLSGENGDLYLALNEAWQKKSVPREDGHPVIGSVPTSRVDYPNGACLPEPGFFDTGHPLYGDEIPDDEILDDKIPNF